MFINVFLRKNLSDFTVKTEGDDVLVFFNSEGWPAIHMSREEALELSCRLEQAAQKTKERPDGLPRLD